MNIHSKTILIVLIISILGLLFSNDQDNLQNNSSFIKIDSLLFVDSSTVPEYPYNDWYASYLKKEQIEHDSARTLITADSNLIIDFFPPKPTLFFVENYTDTISVKEYCNRYLADSNTKSFIILNVKMEWNGNISEIRLDQIKGDIPPNLDLVKLSKKLKGMPPKVNNIPLPGPNNFLFMITCGIK